MQDKYRAKGLTVIGITGEDRATNLRYMLHNDPAFTYRVALGSAPGYETPEFPWSVLIAPDGSVAWQGSPARMSVKKNLKPLLAQVRKPTAVERDVRAAKMLAFADAFAADQFFVRAESAFQALIATYPASEAATTAKARMKSILVADGARAEYDAQKAIVKLVGGVEAPNPSGKRVKNPEREAAKLKKLAQRYAESAPRAARLAREWADIYSEVWK